MPVRVITAPDPILTPASVAGSHAPDDPKIAALIDAVTEELDGPSGWLGRALGPQTLELSLGGFGAKPIKLLYPPLIQITSVKYLDVLGVEQTVPDTVYRQAGDRLVLKVGQAWPIAGCAPDAVRVQYRAGYDGTPASEGGTGKVPERVLQAVILSVQNLVSIGAENLFLRSEEVNGVGTTTYTVSEVAGTIVREAAERLLGNLRVYAL